MKNSVDINRMNYETFVIDYLDGKLNAVETACFIAFLENNPDLKEEVSELNDIVLTPEKKEYSQKDKLKKKSIVTVAGINELNYEEYFIAGYEGDLNETDYSSLLKFIDNNPELDSEYKLHDSLRLDPDTDIIFSDKELLKHKSRLIPIWYSSAAAILLLFAAGWFLTNNKAPEFRTEVVSINKIVPKETNVSLSLITIVKIKTDERQISAIQLSESDFSYDDHEKITVAMVESKNISEQLVNAFDFARLAERRDAKRITSTDNYGMMLADADPIGKEQHRSMFAKIFNNQIAKITKRIGSNDSKGKKSTDPTYVQILDKGVLVFNTLTGNEASTLKKYNSTGELTSYQIEGREILLGRNSSAKSSQ